MNNYEAPFYEFRPNTAKLRAEIEKHTEEFLAKGGTIKQVGNTASAYDLRVAEDKSGRKIWKNKDTATPDFVVTRDGKESAGYTKGVRK